MVEKGRVGQIVFIEKGMEIEVSSPHQEWLDKAISILKAPKTDVTRLWEELRNWVQEEATMGGPESVRRVVFDEVHRKMDTLIPHE